MLRITLTMAGGWGRMYGRDEIKTGVRRYIEAMLKIKMEMDVLPIHNS